MKSNNFKFIKQCDVSYFLKGIMKINLFYVFGGYLLEIRLNTLFDYVDRFVIVEASIDPAGNKRTPKFNMSKFKNFSSKIKFLMKICNALNFTKKTGDRLGRENLQRNALEKGYSDQPDDLIMISDLDEIPNPKSIKDFRDTDKLGCFVCKIFI